MSNYIFALKARTEAMRCLEIFRNAGIYCRIVNTPREAGSGCGISVEVGNSYFAKAREIASKYCFPSAIGWFACEMRGSRRFCNLLCI